MGWAKYGPQSLAISGLAALASAVLLVLAYPDVSWGILALVALVPWWWAWWRGPLEVGRSALLGWIWGMAFFGLLLHWVLNLPFFPWHAWIAGVLYCSLWPAGFAALFTAFARRVGKEAALLWLPAAWTGMEYLRSLGPLGFPWGTLGTSQWNHPLWLQSADLWSFYGLSFLIALTNSAGVAWLLGHPRRRSLTLALVGLWMGVSLYGFFRRRQVIEAASAAPRTSPIALLQGNFPEEKKTAPTVIIDSWRCYTRQAREAARRGARLLILPETAFPTIIERNPWLEEGWKRLARETQACILVGALSGPDYEGEGRPYQNVLIAYGPEGEEGRYAKVRLMVFGEFVPLRRFFPFLGRFSLRDTDHVPGAGWYPLRTSWGSLGVMICYESIFPYIGRALAQRGARLLVVVTNDAWFGPSAAALQHASLAVFRAVETRRPLARCANTGISGFVQPWGEFRPRSGLFTEEVLVDTLPDYAAPTLYLLWGDWFPLLCSLLFLGRWWGGFIRPKAEPSPRRSPPPCSPPSLGTR